MQIPFVTEISRAQTVLIAGAGGGFDIASGIPLYFWLRGLGKQVVLGNLSFSALAFTDSEEICPDTYRIRETPCEVNYFPEKRILEWLRDKDEWPEMYGFSSGMGVLPLRHAYSEIIQRHNVDAVLLVDGGTDSLMSGNESKVGTIVEDACSIVAVAGLNLQHRFLGMIGFGVEHDLNHYACLENMAAMIRREGYLGALSLTRDMPEGKAYLEMVETLNQTIPSHPSIVTNSIASAMQGQFGDFHATRRTKGSAQFISPLMSLYWFFNLDEVARQIHFAAALENTETIHDVVQAFLKYRMTHPRRAHRAIPLE
ncbi:MAG: DUF1152 domain-containing protein [Zoogloeaceae bacterium]|nr:DUF1152 domain-containing protein [Zoogloeaceae bacterium]